MKKSATSLTLALVALAALAAWAQQRSDIVLKLSGGTVGSTYRVTNRIVTAVNGETLDGTIEITVVEE